MPEPMSPHPSTPTVLIPITSSDRDRRARTAPARAGLEKRLQEGPRRPPRTPAATPARRGRRRGAYARRSRETTDQPLTRSGASIAAAAARQGRRLVVRCPRRARVLHGDRDAAVAHAAVRLHDPERARRRRAVLGQRAVVGGLA